MSIARFENKIDVAFLSGYWPSSNKSCRCYATFNYPHDRLWGGISPTLDAI